MTAAKPAGPAESAEGVPVPKQIDAPAPASAPSPQDYYAEHNTWRAAVGLYVGGALAVSAGGAVPASHPLVLDGTWTVENGSLLPADD